MYREGRMRYPLEGSRRGARTGGRRDPVDEKSSAEDGKIISIVSEDPGCDH